MDTLVQSLPTAMPSASGRNLYQWRASSGQIQLSFPASVLESLRFEVSRAGNGVGRIGIGGVLLGVRTEADWSITDWMPIQCDHSRGPSFLLSPSDQSTLRSRLEFLALQESLTGRQVLGWFAAHPRGSFVLGREEAELHERLFRGKLALTVKPDQFGALQIAVHGGNDSGTETLALMEPVFAVEPMPIARRKSGQRRRLESVEPKRAADCAPVAVTRALPPPARSWRIPILVATVLFGAVLVGAVAARTYRARTTIFAPPATKPIEMLSLHAMHRAGRLMVSWNGSAAPISFASHVTLVLHDGKKTTRRVLSRADARAGIQFFSQTSPHISARLVLETPSGAVITEDTVVVDATTLESLPSRLTPDMLPPASSRFQKF